jgi:hypothetical protein
MYIYLDSSGTYVCTPLSGKYTVSLTEMSATSSKKVKKDQLCQCKLYNVSVNSMKPPVATFSVNLRSES